MDNLKNNDFNNAPLEIEDESNVDQNAFLDK